MDMLDTPNGYELLESRDYYSFYLSHEDKGIIGGITLEDQGITLDYFRGNEITDFRAPTITEALRDLKQWHGDIA